MGSDDASAVMKQLEDAWNAGDGAGFGAAFTDDATFVTIRGELHRGALGIGAGHDHIFRTIYSGSRVRYEVLEARQLAPDVAVAQVHGTLTAPSGPLAGTHQAMATVVLVGGATPRVAAFHNTMVA